MKATMLFFIAALFIHNTSGYCATPEATNTDNSQPSENSRIYDKQGNYQGRTVGQGDNVRIYDNKGNFVGRIIQNNDGSSTRIYNSKGNFQGRITR